MCVQLGILNREKKILPTPESIRDLKHQSMKLEHANYALMERDRVLFKMVGEAIQRRDSPRAQIYANELSRLRHIKRIISQSQLAIDCITIRLENFLDLYQIVNEMKPISEAIKSVSAEVQQVIPQFSTVLEQLNEVASEALMQSTIDSRQPSLKEVFSVRSPEGSEILREVSDLVENNLQQSFPEPPIALASRETEAIACVGEAISSPQTSISSEKANDWGEWSDEVVKLLGQIESKHHTKMEEATV
jgi:division protein CdvB (Snf7/Vps24/ESCRT-III family)